MRRQAMEEELQRTAPPATPDLDRAQALLEDFARFWEAEPDPAERRKLIATLLEHVWQKDGSIVAVKPQAAFAKYFVAANEARAKHPKTNRKSGVTKAGATGVGSGLCPRMTATSRSGPIRRSAWNRSGLLVPNPQNRRARPDDCWRGRLSRKSFGVGQHLSGEPKRHACKLIEPGKFM